MAVPKRKTSSHRQGRRRANHSSSLPEITICPYCGADKQPYHVCPNCGKYSSAGVNPERESPPKKKEGKRKKNG